ncbi:pentatricopeptide repeat-containing protein At5g15340, mitochondrial [Phoenix dactylifera]|uniref:Pentatricopeptide repeat-containing protein At5g15340, mitochondrial n=1 Tax=Phoenix dactylifera TaxID=42345 RepID=A0A8B8JAI5_PHODC|nr:pentatricopeptide repeat-containing protein At5g15340, mitochondrial [Phoenix dactylifera]
MVSDGIAAPNSDSDPIPFYRTLLRSCALGHSPPYLGRQLHAALLKSALLLLFPSLSAALFHMYAAAGPPSAALHAFRRLLPPSARSTVAWTALISSHAALPARAVRLFRSMRRAAVPPDVVTLLALLSASARLADPAAAASAHLLFLKLGLPFSVPACNAAIDAYAKCGRMPDARRLFDEMPCPTVVSWTVLLSGTLRREGLARGREVFDRMPQKNEVSWTVMVVSCIEAGLPREALSLLSQMLFLDDSVRNLNHISLCSLLSACSQAGDLTVGRWIHAHFTKTGLFGGAYLLMVRTALVDMYAKCGRIDTARHLFEIMPRRNLVAWNAMLSGLSMHGMAAEVLKLFSRMVAEEALHPDDITFVGVLSACSRSGLVEQGRKLFHELSTVCGLTPKVEHYACMVDLLGRAGRLEEAEALVREMPILPNEVVLGSLLASCSLHGKLDLGRRLMEELVQMDPHNTEYHVLLSNMYASSGRHFEAGNLRETMRRKGIKKAPGISFIEVNGQVHRFSAGDKSHPQAREVYAMLDEVVRRLRLVGYVPDVASQISRVMDNYLENGEEREEREQALLVHSEKLAICFGLISTRPGLPLRIFKNLRICTDCHAAIKLISDIFRREIIVRDRNRFHCFKKGPT